MNIKINGMTMNYVERGTPGGLPVTFIHGFPFSLGMWEPQMWALPNQYRAIAYDVRGHGHSDVGDGQYTVELFVDDLIGLLDHLVIAKTVLCGLSMGGYIALRAIERHPDRINGLILCDTKSTPDTDEGKVKRTATLKSVKMNGVEQFAEGFVKTVFADSTFQSHPEIIDTIKTVIKQTSPIGIGGTLLALAGRTDTTPVLSKIAVPTLILCGERDTLTPPRDSEFMHRLVTGSAFHLIPSSAHLSNLENPGVFNEKLITFLKTIQHD